MLISRVVSLRGPVAGTSPECEQPRQRQQYTRDDHAGTNFSVKISPESSFKTYKYPSTSGCRSCFFPWATLHTAASVAASASTNRPRTMTIVRIHHVGLVMASVLVYSVATKVTNSSIMYAMSPTARMKWRRRSTGTLSTGLGQDAGLW